MVPLTWDYPHPFVFPVTPDTSHCDRLGHVNNTTYLTWLEAASWAHIEPLGMDWATHEATGRAMAIVRTEVDYLASAYAGDALLVGTWITGSDDRLQSERRFQILRLADARTMLRAYCRYTCIDLKSGRPARMPPAFVEAHRQALAAHGLTNALLRTGA